jgi:hypothetical protein
MLLFLKLLTPHRGALEMLKTRFFCTHDNCVHVRRNPLCYGPHTRAHVRFFNPPKALVVRLLEYDLYWWGLRAPAHRSSFECEFEKKMLLLLMMAHHAASSHYFRVGRRNARRAQRASTRR